MATKTANQGSSHQKSRKEMLSIFRAAREEVRAANPEGRDLLEELLAERRREAINDGLGITILVGDANISSAAEAG